jgi:hypothetical protein
MRDRICRHWYTDFVKKRRSAQTMGPGKERFAVADLQQSARDFVDLELAKPPASRFEAICFDARRTPFAEIIEWIRKLDLVQDEEDANPKNDRGYYIRRVVIVKTRRAWSTGVPAEMKDRPDITWIATTDPADGPTIYRRHLTEQFEGLLGRRPKRR